MELFHFESITEFEKWKNRLANANVFYSNGFREYCKLKGCILIYVYSESYIMPVELTEKLFFRYSILPVEPFKYSLLEEDQQEFIENVCSYVRDTFKIQWIDAQSTASLFMTYPKRSKHIPFGSHIINLCLSEEELWKRIHSKHRNVIKKAEKDGIVIESGVSDKLIEDYHSIDVETWRRSNKNAPDLESFKKQVFTLGENAIIYLAYLDEKPQSGAFFFYNRAMCYYMYGANCDKPHTGAGNLLQWRAIIDMKVSGVKKYSFVGCRINEDENSKFHGIQRFKERFGGCLVQGYLFKVIFNKPLYSFFRILLNIRLTFASRNVTLFKDIIDQEINKWEK